MFSQYIRKIQVSFCWSITPHSTAHILTHPNYFPRNTSIVTSHFYLFPLKHTQKTGICICSFDGIISWLQGSGFSYVRRTPSWYRWSPSTSKRQFAYENLKRRLPTIKFFCLEKTPYQYLKYKYCFYFNNHA